MKTRELHLSRVIGAFVLVILLLNISNQVLVFSNNDCEYDSAWISESRHINADGSGTIVFDYSHGQKSSYIVHLDSLLGGNLTEMGYTVVWAEGGINDTILADATGFVAGSMYGDNPYSTAEVSTIVNWYKEGGKFMWIGYDSDYGDGQLYNDNMTRILEGVGSHVYAEPTQVADSISCCVASYRVVATGTSAYIDGVDAVLMHGPGMLYGATGGAENDGAVALETETITGVTPILYYNESAEISDSDLLAPYAHDDGDTGAFVAATWEEGLYTGILVASGASPYGGYMPMCAYDYYDVILDGMSFVTQVIDKAMNGALTTTTTTTTTPTTTTTTATTTDMTTTIDDGGPLMMLMAAGGGIALIAILGAAMARSRRSGRGPSIGPSLPPDEPTPEVAVVAATAAAMTPEESKEVETGKVQILRGCAPVGGRFEYKVKIKNDTEWVITNVTVAIIAYPEDCMEVSGPLLKTLRRIEPGGFRSPQFIFVPTKDCVEGQILATVSYVDQRNKTQVQSVEPYVIRSVCDLLEPLETTLEEFELLLSGMSASREEHDLEWNPEVLFNKSRTFLPNRNFQILESSSVTEGGIFRGTIRGLAEGKYTRKKVALRIVISGVIEGNKSKVIVEGLGEDPAMLPTTISEISKGIVSWTCMNCGAALDPEEVGTIKAGDPIRCKFCGNTMTIDLYLR